MSLTCDNGLRQRSSQINKTCIVMFTLCMLRADIFTIDDLGKHFGSRSGPTNVGLIWDPKCLLTRIFHTYLNINTTFLAHLSKAQGELLWHLIVRRPSCVVRRASCVNIDVNTLEATFFIQSSSNLVRMFVLMMPWPLSNMGQVGSKSRSLGQILEKSC